MVFSIQKRQDQKQRQIDIREAWNLFDLLRSKYIGIELLKTLNNNAHDIDLKKVLDLITSSLEKNSKIVEKYLQEFSIISPDRNREAVNFPQAVQTVTDEFIANQLFVFIQEEIERLVRAHRTTVSNDKIRVFFKKLLLIKLNEIENLIPYLKLKGWIEVPPLFHKTPTGVNEKVSSVDIYHLWHHLTFRYDNINTTEVIIKFAYDGDFVATLTSGVSKLYKQVELLEKELSYFGVPLPNAPGKVTFTPGNTEILKDDHMFRTLLDGMQGAAIMHTNPLKECTMNDRLRLIFKELLLKEIDIIDVYYKLGKVKGWFHPIPLYGT